MNPLANALELLQTLNTLRPISVEQERRIKESELSTELAVEEKRRQIREAQMAADIAVEEQRSALMERWTENERHAADARAYALEKVLAPVRGVDWKVLMAANGGGNDPKLNIALAFREMAENAGKIGELNMSPELLSGLLGPTQREPGISQAEAGQRAISIGADQVELLGDACDQRNTPPVRGIATPTDDPFGAAVDRDACCAAGRGEFIPPQGDAVAANPVVAEFLCAQVERARRRGHDVCEGVGRENVGSM